MLILKFMAGLTCFVGLAAASAAQEVTEYTPEQALALLDQNIRLAFAYPADGGPIDTDPAQWMTLTYVGLEVPVDDAEAMQTIVNLIAVACPPANRSLGTFATAHRLDQVYEVILTQAALRRPDVKIEGIEEAKKALLPEGKPSEKYQTYKEYERLYEEVSPRIRKAETDDEKLELGQEQEHRLEDWIAKGHKKEIGDYIDAIVADAAISDSSAIAWRLSMLAGYRRITNAQFGGQRFSPVRPKSQLVPGVKSWQGDAGWTKVKLNKNQKWQGDTAKYDATSQSYSINGGGFFWKASGSYSKSESSKSEKHVGKVSNLGINFEVRRAIIDRPWFDQRLLFEPGFWTWLKPEGTAADAELPLVSKGVDGEGVPIPNDDSRYSTYRIPIPVVPSEVVVARNLTLTATVSKSDYERIDEASKTDWSAGGSGGFLFWRLGAKAGGSRESTLTKTNETADTVDFELSTKGPVVIGLISNVVPKLPSPRLQAMWPKNAWFPPGEAAEQIDPDNAVAKADAPLPTSTLANEDTKN